ncbi:hypothetical protein ACVNPX_12900 [Staphylococcus aureus]
MEVIAMIKQINVSNMQKFESQLMKAQSEGYTHVVPYANEIMIYQSMLDAVQLYPKSIIIEIILWMDNTKII